LLKVRREATQYASRPFRFYGRRHLRSANTVSLVVPSTRRTTLGDRAFPAAAARAWNDLPSTIRASPLLLTFRQQLKHSFFKQRFIDLIMAGFSELN